LGLGGDTIEGSGGAEIDNDAGCTVLFDGRDGVDDAICANFCRIVVEHWHSGFYAGFDEEWFQAEVALADAAEDRI